MVLIHMHQVVVEPYRASWAERDMRKILHGKQGHAHLSGVVWVVVNTLFAAVFVYRV
jgi:hypothetical protein